jgi:hypothetical protein
MMFKRTTSPGEVKVKGLQRISRKAGKAKARALQKWVCAKVSELTGFDFGKDEAIESRPMGQKGVDVRLTPEVKRLFPFSVECKFCEGWSVPGWIEQAQKNRVSGTDWLLVLKRSRQEPVVLMDASAFFELLEKMR